MFVFMSAVVTVWRSVGMFVVYRPLLKIVVFSLGVIFFIRNRQNYIHIEEIETK